jgi:hypothetical protein
MDGRQDRHASSKVIKSNKVLFRWHPNSKFFHSLSITSIFSRLYEVLNIDKKISLVGNYEMNLLSLVGPRLNNIYQIRRKRYYLSGLLFLPSKRGPSVMY